eukprot:gene5497-9314_t
MSNFVSLSEQVEKIEKIETVDTIFKNLLEALKNAETKKINEIINKPDRKLVQTLLCHTDENGDTPLHISCTSKKESKIILFLIEKGSDIYTKNKKGLTPLDTVNPRLRGLMRATFEVRDLKIKVFKEEIKLQQDLQTPPQEIFAQSF